MTRDKGSSKALRNRIVFCVCVVLWFVLDRVTKLYFEAYSVDMLVAPSIGGIVEFRLVHNRGAAWGSFSGMVDILVIVTALLCIAILVYAFITSRRASLLEMIGLALVLGGGVGNLVDRVVNGYVIDFISPLFIDFPTFNIADIGITCGIVCVVIALAVEWFRPSATRDEQRERAS